MCTTKGEPNEPNPPTRLGRLCLFYPSGDEGGAGVLRCDDAVGGARDFGSGALEAGDSVGDRPDLMC